MPSSPVSRDITGQMIVLGSGTSVGVPVLGCGCAVCTSTNPKNYRTRCGLALGLPGGTLLVDTPPDLRQQLLRERIGVVHAVVYTHEHADHIFGLDDLRIMQFYIGGPAPLYCGPRGGQRIRKSFDYAFQSRERLHPGAIPQLSPQTIGLDPFEALGTRIVPLRLQHGPHTPVLGFRIGNIAYCTDTSGIPPESIELLADLDVLLLDCLRRQPHVTHFGMKQALAVVEQLRPKTTLFTHISHDLEHEETNAELPTGVSLAYDGQCIPLS